MTPPGMLSQFNRTVPVALLPVLLFAVAWGGTGAATAAAAGAALFWLSVHTTTRFVRRTAAGSTSRRTLIAGLLPLKLGVVVVALYVLINVLGLPPIPLAGGVTAAVVALFVAAVRAQGRT